MPRFKHEPIDSLPRMYSVKDIAAYFQLSEATIIMRCKKHPHTMPPFINMGTINRPIFRFPADDVAQFIKYITTQRGTAVLFNSGPKDEAESGPEIVVDDNDAIFDLPVPESKPEQ